MPITEPQVLSTISVKAEGKLGASIKRPDNLGDVLFFTVALMEKHPAVMVPWFDRHEGIQCVFQLLGLPDEDCRLYALKMLGFFLKYSKP
ncbi:hypothetical protein ACTXT7_017409, partial [Hymenolepis weldensis]